MKRIIGTLFLSLCCTSAVAQLSLPGNSIRPETDPDTFYAVLLGTGIPLPNPERACAATLIVAGDRSVLIDTGRASLSRLVSAGFQDVSMVLYTHFHSDHISELGEIMVNRGITGVDEPLSILGPRGTREVVDGILGVYAKDTQYRVDHHGEHWPENGMKADVREFDAGVIYDEHGLKITMFDVDHEPIEPAVGYRIDYRGRSVVVAGDTKKVPQMVEMARDCDLLIHEAVNKTVLRRLLPVLQRNDPRRAAMMTDMMSHHTSTLEVAEIARDAKVKKVALTHLVPSIAPGDATERAFIQGMSAIYDGPILVGRDGMRIDL